MYYDCLVEDAYPVERSTVVKVAEEILADRRERFPAMCAALMKVAETAKYLSMNWAEVTDIGRCGCLIGTYRMKKGLSPIPGEESSVQTEIGMDFYWAMKDELELPDKELPPVIRLV